MNELELLDWKRRIFELYAEVRAAGDPAEAWDHWRAVRDELFRTHPQSPLTEESRERFGGVDYFPYDPALRVLAEVEPAEDEARDIAGSAGSCTRFRRFARARFELGGVPQVLELYWLEAYGGGVFVPVRRPDPRRGDVRRRPLRARHGQRLGSGRGRRPARARLQLRLQPVLRLRPALGMPADAAREPARRSPFARASG